MTTDSGVLSQARYGFTTRFGDEKGTNPEELIAAAHAGCFSMALSAQLEGAGFQGTSVDTQATATFEKLEAGFTVTGIHLDVAATVPGADDAAFQALAEKAKTGCPISRLLAPGTAITMTARLR